MTIQAIDSDTNITQSIDLFSEYTATGQPSSSLNYYNAILGVVRLAQATNLQQYINLAQSSCQNWWQYGLDHGYNIVIPRNAGWHALMACASMFGYNWWGVPVTSSPGSGLAYSLTYSGFFNGLNPTTPSDRDSLPGGLDVRETAFLSRSAAIFAHVYPAHTSSPSTTRATWCGYAANEVTNTWLNPWNPPSTRGLYSVIHSGQDVYWQDGSFGTGNNMAAPNAGTPPGNIENTAMGTSPWRDSGLSNIAMMELYRIMANSTDCSNPGLASTIQTASERAASYIWDYGRSPDGGLYYNSGYLSDGQGWSGTDSIHNKESEYGDVSGNITVSGTAVTSSAPNSAFIRRFGGGSISQITLNSTNYTVSSVTDNAHMTLATAPSAGSYCPDCWSNPATIAVTNGSSTVVGTGTNFLTMFNCNGTDYIGILGNSASFQDNGVYLVSSCADNTHLTLSTPWVGVTNQSAQNDFSWSNAASTNCSPSIGTCEPDEYSGKSLAADWAVSLAQTYQWTQSPTWFSRAQYGLGSLYGGPSAGPAFYQPVSGPQSTLAWGNFDAIIPGCNQTNGVQPCSSDGNDGSGHFAKEFGMSTGAGNAPNAIADYLTPALGGSVTLPLFRSETLRQYIAH